MNQEALLINKFPNERKYAAIVWFMLATGGTLVLISFRAAPWLGLLWIGIVGVLAIYMLVSHEVEFGPTSIRECKRLFGLILLSDQVIAARRDAVMLLLVTTPGPSQDNGALWLHAHELVLVLKDETRVGLQKFDASTEGQPSALMQECRQLASRLSLPFAHSSSLQ